MPEISVIVPVYNSEKYLKRCIDSILNQTFTDFEVILIDDGSPDNCGIICDSYAEKDKRIRVMHQENAGQAAARNHALDIAQGEYISFVDSDDYIHPKMLEFLWNNAQLFHAQISICGHEIVKETIPYPTFTFLPVRCWNGKEFVRKCLMGEITDKAWVLWDKIYHKDCFKKLRLPEGRIFEDNAVVYRILYEADTVVECDESLYYYCFNEESTVNQAFQRKHLDALLVLEEIIDYFTKNSEPLLVEKFNRRYLLVLEDMYRKVCQYIGDQNIAKEIRKKLKKQYRSEKKKYPITIQSNPGIYEILYPRIAYCYWTYKGILKKFLRNSQEKRNTNSL